MGLGPMGGIVGALISTTSGANATVVQLTTQQSQLMFFSAGNNNAAPRFLRFFDTGVVPNLNLAGATSSAGIQAAYVFEIPGNVAGAGSNLAISNGPPQMSGLQFNAGIAVAITSNYAIADNSGVSGVNECFATVGYR